MKIETAGLENDIREIALRSVFPTGIALKDYGRAVELLANLTVSMLANGYKIKKAPTQAVTANASGTVKLRRPGQAMELVRQYLETGPKTAPQLSQAMGQKNTTNIYGYLKKLGAKKLGDGTYSLGAAAPAVARRMRKRKGKPTKKEVLRQALQERQITIEEAMTLVGSERDSTVHILRKIGARKNGEGVYHLNDAVLQ